MNITGILLLGSGEGKASSMVQLLFMLDEFACSYKISIYPSVSLLHMECMGMHREFAYDSCLGNSNSQSKI